MGTANGLSIMNREGNGFTNYLVAGNNKNKGSRIAIHVIRESPEGVFWLGTDHGIIQFSEKRGIINSWANEGLSDNEPIQNIVFALEIDKNQKLWIGTRGGLDRFDLVTKKI